MVADRRKAGPMAEQMETGRGGLLPAYLIVGPDRVKARAALERLRKRLAASGEPEFNSEEFSGSALPDPASLRASLDTLPFGGDFRLVVIEGVDKAAKAATEMLVDYLADPCPTTVVAMTAEKLAKTTRLYKAVDKVGDKAVISCEARKRRDLPELVARMARQAGSDIDPATADLLVQLVGESTEMLENEVGKLALASGGGPITERLVRANVARIAQVKPWDLLDAVSKREPAEAMRLLRLMPAQGLVGLQVLLVSRIRHLIAAKSLSRRGQAANLAQELGLQGWQVRNFPAWARNYTMGELVGALRGACACEAALKSTPDKTLALQRWILSFCTPRRA